MKIDPSALSKLQARLQAACLTCTRSASKLPESMLQVRTCWDRAIESAGGLDARQAAVAAFNQGSRFRKRGIALTPTKFGISFTTKFLNQVTDLCKAFSAQAGLPVVRVPADSVMSGPVATCQGDLYRG